MELNWDLDSNSTSVNGSTSHRNKKLEDEILEQNVENLMNNSSKKTDDNNKIKSQSSLNNVHEVNQSENKKGEPLEQIDEFNQEGMQNYNFNHSSYEQSNRLTDNIEKFKKSDLMISKSYSNCDLDSSDNSVLSAYNLRTKKNFLQRSIRKPKNVLSQPIKLPSELSSKNKLTVENINKTYGNVDISLESSLNNSLPFESAMKFRRRSKRKITSLINDVKPYAKINLEF